MNVMTAGITAEGESNMTTTTTQEQSIEPAVATAAEPNATKANTASKKARVAPGKGKSAKKATAAQKRAKAPKAAKKAKAPEADGPREGSKTAQVVAMLRRRDGASLEEIMEKMGWQKHTVRGFMAGAMKKAGFTVESFKSENGERTYRMNR